MLWYAASEKFFGNKLYPPSLSDSASVKDEEIKRISGKTNNIEIKTITILMIACDL